MGDVKCDGCNECFNTDSRRPRLLICCHSLCLQCVQDGIVCSEHPDIPIEPDALRDDEIILFKLGAQGNILQHWCSECRVLRDGPCPKRHVTHVLEDLVRPLEDVVDHLYQFGSDLQDLHKTVRACFKRLRFKSSHEQREWHGTLHSSLGALRTGAGAESLIQASTACSSRAAALQRVLGARGKLRLQLPATSGPDPPPPVEVDLDGDGEESRLARLLLLLLHEKSEGPEVPTEQASTKCANKSSDVLVIRQPFQNKSESIHSGKQARGTSMQTSIGHSLQEGKTVSSNGHSSLSKVLHTNRTEVKGLIEKLYQHVLQSSILTPLQLDSDSTVARVFNSHQDRALQSVAQVILQKTMRGVKKAGCFSLLVDTVAVPVLSEERGDLVSLAVRYCRSSGDAIEQLVALEESRSATGESLFRRVASLCEAHGVDWRQSLCGVAMDQGGASGREYRELLRLLQEGAQQAHLVWNAAHRISDLVINACRYSVGKHFLQVLDSLRDFFSQPKYYALLIDCCGKSDVYTFREFSHGDLIMLVHENHKKLHALLKRLSQCNASSMTARKSRELMGAVSELEFLATLGLFVDLLNSMESLQEVLLFSTPKNVADTVMMSLLGIRSMTTEEALRKYLLQAKAKLNALESYRDSFEADQEKRISKAMGHISKTVIDIVSSRFQRNISVIRDFYNITSALDTSRSSPRPPSSLNVFQRINGIDMASVGHELVNLFDEVRCGGPGAPAAELAVNLPSAVDRLMKMVARPHCAERYPNLHVGLRVLLSLPLLPTPAEGASVSSLLGLLRGQRVPATTLERLEASVVVKSFGAIWGFRSGLIDHCLARLSAT